MTVARRRTRWAAAGAAAALGLGAVLVASTGTASASITASSAPYTVKPLMKQFTRGRPAALPVNSDCVANYGLGCYGPAQIRKAYNIPDSFTGAGEKIAIIDAFGSPTAAADLEIFSEEFGLPSADFHVYCPNGCDWPTDPTVLALAQDWAGEVSLDVQWAHAIAPAAQINLVVSPTSDNGDMNKVTKYAVDHNLGDVLSMSFGSDEAEMVGNSDKVIQSHAIFLEAAAKGISLFASAGDGGASDGYPVANASYPASDPLVTSVGGTNLFAADDGTYQSETVWNDGDPTLCPYGCAYGPFGATGGAVSKLFSVPLYQFPSSHKLKRSVSDVSYNGSVYTSVLVYNGYFTDPADNGFYFTGGTSSGSPQWAAIGALADQAAGHRLGQLNPLLYALSYDKATYKADFHDVTVGNNAFDGPGFPAGKGWDLPTGLGSPNVANLVHSLVRLAH